MSSMVTGDINEMDKSKTVFYQRLFFIAALWNIAAAIAVLFIGREFQIEFIFGSSEVVNSFNFNIFYYFFWYVVLVLGVGYYIVSRDIMRNRGIAFLGILGKIGLFVIFLYAFSINKATLYSLLLFFGDFIWGVLFAVFLYQTRGGINKLSSNA